MKAARKAAEKAEKQEAKAKRAAELAEMKAKMTEEELAAFAAKTKVGLCPMQPCLSWAASHSPMHATVL